VYRRFARGGSMLAVMTRIKEQPLARPSSDTPLIRLDQISKTYTTGGTTFAALRDVSIAISAGECVSVVGRSGSGKTTLINLLTGIDRPSQGDILVGGSAIHRMTQEELAQWRGRTVGIVFQFFQLLPTLSVVENVMLPMDFCNMFAPSTRRDRAQQLLARLGIADQADKLPANLSGGQQQRAAIARAMANNPPLIVADEPTGNLDSATSDDVMSLLASLAAEGHTVLTVTHEPAIDRFFTRRITLRDGRVEQDTRVSSANAI
jgi:putative ABC transport system ATP-binding protein